MKCSACGETEKRIINSPKYGKLCGKCYQREKNNPIRYELPGYGEITYNPEGLPICHICGKAYHKILAHAWQIHGISAYDYKKEFGLETTKGIMSKESRELASTKVYKNYEVSIKENLLERGKPTRFTEGHRGRTKELVSEQTRHKLIKQVKTLRRNENVKSSIC